jgi:hypothetical protein
LATADRIHERNYHDLTAEFQLRKIEPLYEPVRPIIEDFEVEVMRRLNLGAKPVTRELEDKIEKVFREEKKPKHRRSYFVGALSFELYRRDLFDHRGYHWAGIYSLNRSVVCFYAESRQKRIQSRSSKRAIFHAPWVARNPIGH